jgi:hypothetical protein
MFTSLERTVLIQSKRAFRAVCMVKQNIPLIFLIMFIRETHADLPNYVHLHTQEEIIDTHHVILNKLNICANTQNNDRSLLIAIKSAAVNMGQRETLRLTWLNEVKQYKIPYVFVLSSTRDRVLFEDLMQEDKLHNDLLIGKTIENYYNLTLKSIFILNWSMIHCSTRWLLYVDDDVIVNVRRVIDFIASVKNVSDSVLYCRIHDSIVSRDPQSKWFVSASTWPSSHFPTFCRGFGVLISPHILPALQKASTDISTQPKLWLDDVYINGIAAKAANVTPVFSEFQCCGDGGFQLFQTSLVLGEMGEQKILLENWRNIRRNSTHNLDMLGKRMLLMSDMPVLNKTLYYLAATSAENKVTQNRWIANYHAKTNYYGVSLAVSLIILIVLSRNRRLAHQVMTSHR